MSPNGSEENHTPLKQPQDSSLTCNESENIYFKVSKLEDMIKGMDTKKDLKRMTGKEYVQGLKELVNISFIPKSSTQEEDKEEKGNLFQSHIAEIEK